MTTSNFKSFALATLALFTIALTSCSQDELAGLTPLESNELKKASLSLDPHDMISDDNGITKPYNNLNKPYNDFLDEISDGTYGSATKPAGPIHTATSKKLPVKPGPVTDDIRIVREDIGPYQLQKKF
ncbi:MAG: hypothetical protein AAF502_12470 [Bacteroidota bacterium]